MTGVAATTAEVAAMAAGVAVTAATGAVGGTPLSVFAAGPKVMCGHNVQCWLGSH